MARSILLTLITYLKLCAGQNFPEDFIFGVATSAYQIEGAWNLSGKGENIWDRMTHTNPGYIEDGSNGDMAIDSYHRYQEDVDQLAYLGVHFYRFSLSWARLLPNGRIDHINPDGIRYYNSLLDALEARNITPYVTLFHWDLPQKLQDLGGWTNAVMIEYFYDYAQFCFREFGNRVKNWITFNEPVEICMYGYGDTLNVPAIDAHGVGDYLCSDTILKSHAKVYHLYNDTYRATQQGKIMLSINSIWFEPSDPSDPELVQSAETANQFKFGWFAHPVYSEAGGYPQVMIDNVAKRSAEEGLRFSRMRQFDEEWREYIKGTADYLGINYYVTYSVTPGGADSSVPSPSWLKDLNVVKNLEMETLYTNFKYEASGFSKTLMWCKDNYQDPEMIITENGLGISYETDGLTDYERIRSYNDYISEILKGILKGVKVIGYTAWTLSDNFEWRSGYSVRYGLFHVNFSDSSLPRTKKLSADYYKEIIATKRLPHLDDFLKNEME